jgi:23S rRNA pseudouridine2604 synthase
MSGTRKTLGLPSRAEAGQAPADPHRKPVRPGPLERKRTPGAGADQAARPASSPKKKVPDPASGRHGGMPANKTRAGREPPPQSDGPPAGVRVAKLMSERGLCSRREADEFIVRGWVYVDGARVCELGTRADPSAAITLDQEARAAQHRQVTLLLHKPVGYVSSQPEAGCRPAVVLIQPENQQRSSDTPLFHPSHLKGLAPAGRLDADSAGLLVFTQDGRVARRLIGEHSKVEKEYLVRVQGRLIDDGLALLNHGLALDGKPLKPARVEWLNDDQLRFILNEGRKRQIRRMCELVGLRVTGLKRVRIGAVRLGNLPSGQWRYLRAGETF